MDLKDFNSKTWLLGALRRLSSRYPPRYITKIEARVERGKYRCKKCSGLFGPKEVQVDHIDPVGTFETWDKFIEKLFCAKEGFQLLCFFCHQEKTSLENSSRRKKKGLTKKVKDAKLKE